MVYYAAVHENERICDMEILVVNQKSKVQKTIYSMLSLCKKEGEIR